MRLKVQGYNNKITTFFAIPKLILIKKIEETLSYTKRPTNEFKLRDQKLHQNERFSIYMSY